MEATNRFKHKGILVGIVMYLIFVFGLYAIIYAAPKIQMQGIQTEEVQYAQVPIADHVTALFVRDETLYTAAYTGKTQYLSAAGTKVRAGTQVLYIEPGEIGRTTDDAVSSEEVESVSPIDAILNVAGSDAAAAEGGVTPTTAIVSYYADGWEKKITPDNVRSLPRSVFTDAPAEAVSIAREWVRAGEPVYRITNNNLWRVAFWIDGADKPALDKYSIGRKVTLDLGTTKVRATVESADPRGKDIFVVIRSDMYYKDLDKYRVQDISVVFSEVRGAVIDKQAVKLKSGQPGVYVKQLGGAFKWIPVKVLKESEGRYVVEETRFTDKDGNVTATVKYYDEIMSNPAGQGY